jgi:drug/metabolite transporter (DMT)-like permease
MTTMTIHRQRKLSLKQVQVSRTSIINYNSAMIIIFSLLCFLASFDLSSSFVPQQQQRRGGEMGRRIQAVNQHKSASGTATQLLRRLSPLRAHKTNNNNNNYDCARNSTATSSSYATTVAATTTRSTTDINTVSIYQRRSEDEDDDDIRLQRFMKEALSELESFQTTSTTSSSTTSYDEVSLLFPENKIPQQQQQIVNNLNNVFFSAASSISIIRDDNEDQQDSSSSSSSSSISSSSSSSNALVPSKNNNNNKNVDNNSGVVNVNDNDVQEEEDEEKTAAIWRARWLLVAAAALYGTNFSVVKLLGDEMPVGISSSLRFGLAAFATLPWLLDGFLPIFSGKNNNHDNDNNNDNSNSQQLEGINKVNANTNTNNINHNAILDNSRVMATLWGLEVGMWNSFGYVAQAVGLETTLASKSAFLCSMAVVIVPLLDWIAGKTLVSRQWIGAMMALVGVAFLELGGASGVSASASNIIGDNTEVALSGFSALTSDITTGDLLSMVQPFAFGLGFWRMEQAMNQYPEEAPRMTAAQLMAVFISSFVYGLYTLDVFDSNGLVGLQSSLATIEMSFPWKEWFTDPSILFSLFWTGCITTALTIYMETLALESLSAAETTLIFSTEPLWGTAFAVALMGEQIGMNAAVGGSLILAACLYSNLGIDGLQNMLKQGIGSIKEKGQSINPS